MASPIDRNSRKLTSTVQDVIVTAINAGATRVIAAAAAGISRSTMKNWMKWGESEANSDDEKDNESPLAKFYLAVVKAESDAASRWLRSIEDATPDDWRAGAWLLERRFPQDYGRDAQGDTDEPSSTTVKTTGPVIIEVIKDQSPVDEDE